MIIVIDNYDSFTYNLVSILESLGAEIKVYKNDDKNIDELFSTDIDRLLISPGSGLPQSAGQCEEIIKEFSGKIPILGICLGHQCIGKYYGSEMVHANEVVYGKSRPIIQCSGGKSQLFKGLPKRFSAARYHAWVIKNVPEGFILTAESSDGDVMAMENQSQKIYSLQFHPESFMSDHGRQILDNFLHV